MPANPWVTDMSSMRFPEGPTTLATLFSHMWPRIVAGIFIPVGNHYFQALASTLQFVAQVCDRLWLVPATDRAFAYITYMSPKCARVRHNARPHVAKQSAQCGRALTPLFVVQDLIRKKQAAQAAQSAAGNGSPSNSLYPRNW